MGVESVGFLAPLPPLSRNGDAGEASPAGGFGRVLASLLNENQQASASADAAVQDLVTGQAQDLHTVAAAVAQADLSFRLILELRNRLTEAFQEVTRMQI